ncbi:MAG: pyridoxal-dependent decarboxylase [Micavibrio aeruginosavorus]|uniref:Pyridoxal-dependent decarboxylase n=1 Tax=Micavibrio aeruginosavorus TaxID=349221 RepID=A0A2W5HMU5_9BACT|nr:MAG: pyridoxal-dependent decarboxylase [Micavibrio aeruginosavorus]
MKGQRAENEIGMSESLRPRLRPRLHPHIKCFLDNKPLLFDLVKKWGSPLNLIFPQNMPHNLVTFQNAYKKHNLRGTIYYTSKPCKSQALYREASGHDIGIDVSSVNSLKAAVDSGWKTSRIGATGPKSLEYIENCLRHNVLINVDNLDELHQIAKIHSEMGLTYRIKITLRIADYQSSRVQFIGEEDNTFGIATDDIENILTFLEQNKEKINFLGFSWHASTAGDEQRIAAMENLLRLTFLSIKHGLKPVQINIGGGFPIMYADSCEEWNRYVEAFKSSVMGHINSQAWNNNGLGFRLEGGVLRGSPSFLNHAPVCTKGEELERWLSFRLPSFGNARFSDVVRDSLLKLCIEPGRGLLDQCGVTLGRVAFTKISPKGNRLIGLEMNRSNIHSDHFKRLTEPIVISQNGEKANLENEGVFYMGNLCLSYDMLQYNRTYPDYLPEAGDIVAFANTAAYMMDFTESETLMQPIAKKIAVVRSGRAWKCIEDSEYRRAA